jgi:hypothetical protein
MKIGTKSLLFGIHQIFWHPFVVCRAWLYLYGRPSFKELICIFIHDWGYFGKPNLDGERMDEGKYHPALGAKIAGMLFSHKEYLLCAGHSRSYAKLVHVDISKLCWADKLSFAFEPCWFYLLRARLSGELKEIRSNPEYGLTPDICDKDWFHISKQKIIDLPEIQFTIKYRF